MHHNHTPTRILISGATGLVGKALLKKLLHTPEITHIYAPVRKPLGITDSKLHILTQPLQNLPPIDTAYICLGTTIKVAGSKAAFRAVDYDLVLQNAQAAIAAGASCIAVVSALGSKSSSNNFYLRCKGEMEHSLNLLAAKNGFCLVMLRPSLLSGDRNEPRLGEQIGILFSRMFKPLIPKRYRPVHADAVAATLYQASLNCTNKHVQIIESEHILPLPV